MGKNGIFELAGLGVTVTNQGKSPGSRRVTPSPKYQKAVQSAPAMKVQLINLLIFIPVHPY